LLGILAILRIRRGESKQLHIPLVKKMELIKITVSPVMIEEEKFVATVGVSIKEEALTPSTAEIFYERLSDQWGEDIGIGYRVKRQVCLGDSLPHLKESIQIVLNNAWKGWTDYKYQSVSSPLTL
jgi:hypothetical protein